MKLGGSQGLENISGSSWKESGKCDQNALYACMKISELIKMLYILKEMLEMKTSMAEI